MKVAALILAMFLAAVSVAGQVATNKNDIPESQYVAAANKSWGLLKTANYRLVWTKEYLEDSPKAATLKEKTLHEVVQPDKWRTVEEKFYEKSSREEVIGDGKVLYVRTNDGPWSKGGRKYNYTGQIQFGSVKEQYRYLPTVGFEGKKADFYEHISVMRSKALSKTGPVVVRLALTTRIWYSTDGKILKKTQGIGIEGLEEKFRETTTYEYDPKDLKIDVPIK